MKLLLSMLTLLVVCQFSYGQDVGRKKNESVTKELEKQFFPGHKLNKDFHFDFPEPFNEVNIPTKDGYTLNGLLFKVKQSRGLIFYLHGSNGAVDTWGKIAPIYNNLGYDIFILDYRGYGKSESTVTDERQLNSDIQIAYHKLK